MAFNSDIPLQSNQLPLSIDYPAPDDPEFLDVLTLDRKNVADSMNSKEGAQYLLNEQANFRQFFTSGDPQINRNSYRKVFDMVNLNGGNIPALATRSFLHGISGLFETDLIYASCKSVEATPRFFTVVFPDTWLDATKVYFTNPLGVPLSQVIVVANYLKN